MTKRVLISSTKFRALKKTATVDVDSPNVTADDVAFDGFGTPYAAILWAGSEDTGSFPSQQVNPYPWIPSLADSYDYKTSTRWIKTFNSYRDKGINKVFTAPPAVLWMVKDGSQATPSYSYIQQTAWSGSGSENWSGAAVWCSTALDSNGYVDLTIRYDRSDFAASAPYSQIVSYVVFQNFTGLGQLQPA